MLKATTKQQQWKAWFLDYFLNFISMAPLLSYVCVAMSEAFVQSPAGVPDALLFEGGNEISLQDMPALGQH